MYICTQEDKVEEDTSKKKGEKAKVVRQKEGEKEKGEEKDEDDEEVCV